MLTLVHAPIVLYGGQGEVIGGIVDQGPHFGPQPTPSPLRGGPDEGIRVAVYTALMPSLTQRIEGECVGAVRANGGRLAVDQGSDRAKVCNRSELT